LARACLAHQAALIHISTDYVFGGDGHAAPRTEGEAPCPINAYGRSKLFGEEAVKAGGGRSLIVRTAWLFGFEGDFIHRMAQKALRGDRLQVTEQAGTPTPARALADGLWRLAAPLINGASMPPVLHLAGSPVTSRATWAERALRAAIPGFRDLERVDSALFAGAGAVRPIGTPLDSGLAARQFDLRLDWGAAADAYRLEALS
jgi:dTDP-4-dehydrorhamnose reductase